MPVEAAMEAVGTKSYDGLREATPNDLITYIAVKQQPWILKWEYRLMFSHKGAATLVRDFKVRWHFPKDEDQYYIKGGVPLSEEAKAQGWREIRKPVEIVGCLDCYSTEPDPEPEEEDFDLTLPLNQEACRTLTGKGKELSHGSPSSSKTPFWEARSPTQQREMRVGSAFSGLRIKTDSPQRRGTWSHEEAKSSCLWDPFQWVLVILALLVMNKAQDNIHQGPQANLWEAHY